MASLGAETNMLGYLRRYGTLIGIACVLSYFWIELPDTFMTSRNLLNITQQMSMLAVVAFTMTVVMAMGDFDLSVGAMASLAGVVAAVVFVAGGPPYLGIAAALLAGLALGQGCFRKTKRPNGKSSKNGSPNNEPTIITMPMNDAQAQQ